MSDFDNPPMGRGAGRDVDVVNVDFNLAINAARYSGDDLVDGALDAYVWPKWWRQSNPLWRLRKANAAANCAAER